WYMPWYGDYTREAKYNSLELWKKMFAHDYVITLDEMPELRTYQRQDSANPQEPTGIWDHGLAKAEFIAYPTWVKDEITVKSRSRLRSITLYNMLGEVVQEEQLSCYQALVSLADLLPGIYLLRINQKESIKVVKE
ncbi:MAG: T9SS type A sorting domain-containing protein, partial [Bacteroidetes bacterium]|nr:T9SS type A sorting domain-containing protein [Bacteroidota bacterium]